MPLATAAKVEALRADFRSAAQLADMLGVSRSQVTRWLRGSGIDPLNAERVDVLDLVWSALLRVYEREAALSWLFGVNPRLGDRRPIDLVRAGRAEELMRAIRADRAESCIAEQLAAFRGQRLVASILRRRGLPLALARVELGDDAELIDLDDPAVLNRERLRPSRRFEWLT